MKKLILLAAAVAAGSLFAAEWDFTAGVPAGGKLARDGFVTESGLASHSLTNIRTEGGYRLDKPFAYPTAFRLEVEADFGLPDSELDPKVWRMEYLWDDIGETPGSKAPNGRGVSLMVQRHGGEQRLFLRLGYGDRNEVVHGPELKIPRGTRAKVAFTYTANGKVVWETPSGRREDLCVGRGQIPSNTKQSTKIGDRIWPNWYKFDGTIRRVAVIPVERASVEMSVSSPRAFLRASGKRDFRVSLTNFAEEPLSSVELTLVRGDERIVRRLEGVAAAGSAEAVFPVETCLKPGWRDCTVTAKGVTASGRKVSAVLKTAIGIGPRPGDRMLALMQDSNDLVKECADTGVTVGQFGDGSQFFVRDIPADRNPFIRRLREKLDEALVAGVGYGFSGKRDQPTFEEAPAFEHVWEDYGRAFAEYDAFKLAVPYSERRDKSYPDLRKDAVRFKAATGLDMPKEVVSNRVARFKVKASPDGIVQEDDPVLSFYRWYWSGGDQWPAYFDRFGAAIRRGVNREDFQTLWDPSVRCPPRWGSGGGNSILSQWIYADPEPMAVAGSAEEVLAMCAGRPGQKPIIHTQLMCYSRRIAPSEVTVSPRPAWQDRFGGCKFLATPADVVCEATWMMFAKPMYGYSFYPFTCMVETSNIWYPYSDPRLGPEMKRLLKDVLSPLGPVFKRLGRAEPEVAVFESFTSTVLGAPFAMGWNAPPVTFMQRANLDPKVVYEETLERDGFGGLKVVFAPNCRYLTPKLVDLFRGFQAKGGVLVGDGELLKALKADVTVPTVRFAPPPKSDWVTEVEENQAADPKIAERRAATRATKDAMCANAAKLRQALAGRYESPSRSSSPDIIVYNRRFGETDYLFAVNDRRTFGDYVGQWGLLMEKGLPNEGQVAMRDADNRVKAVYELSKGGEVPFVRTGDFVEVPVKFSTTDGRVFAFLHERIAKVEATAAVRDGGIGVTMKVLDESGRPLDALLPVEIRVYDAAGAELDGAGYCAAVNGVAEAHVLANLDDARGAYRIICRDRASGRSATVSVAQPDARRQEAVCASVALAAGTRPTPSENLLKRIDSGIERYGIVHFSVNTFTDREWGYGNEDPALFNPTAFDADQIVGACRDGGLQGLIVVAKHHDGFCLWPTKTTEHNITKSPFRGGKGDYVREMEQACRRHGLKFGVYCSPWDRNNAAYATSEYVKTYHAQVEELNDGRYGEIFEMWFDGANGGDGYYGGAWEKRSIGVAAEYYGFARLLPRVREFQPGVCFFGAGGEFRWPGNERGIVPPESGATRDDGTFKVYEADFPHRPGWFYHASQDGFTRSGEFLMKVYLRTVGNAATMNVGIAPDRRGRLTDEDVSSLRRFDAVRKSFFSKPVATAAEPFNVVVMSEDVTGGERVDAWRLLLDGRELASGGKIGSKRIRVLENPVSGRKLKLAVTKGDADAKEIKISLFAADGDLVRRVLSSSEPTRAPAPFERRGVLTSRKPLELVYMMKHPARTAALVLTPDPAALGGTPVVFRLSHSCDGVTWTEDPVERRLDNVAANPIPQTVKLEKPFSVKYLKLRVVRTLEPGVPACLKDVEFVGEKKP